MNILRIDDTAADKAAPLAAAFRVTLRLYKGEKLTATVTVNEHCFDY